MADPTESSEAPSVETPVADIPKPKGGVVTVRRVVSVPLSVLDAQKAKDATAAAVASGRETKPRNEFRVNLVPMKRKHDLPGGRTASFMSDLK